MSVFHVFIALSVVYKLSATGSSIFDHFYEAPCQVGSILQPIIIIIKYLSNKLNKVGTSRTQRIGSEEFSNGHLNLPMKIDLYELCKVLGF